MTTRILTILVSVLMATLATPASASELDNEAKIINEQALRGKDLPGTVIVRINAKGEASVLEIPERLAQDAGTVALIHTKKFTPINSAGTQELDRASSTSSWFAWYNRGHYYAPTYYYSGYGYNYWNCFTYTFAGFNYLWYRWW